MLVVLFATGCNLLAREEDVPGTYMLQYPFGTETIIIAADHTFAQEVVVPEDNRTLRIKGKWSFHPEHVRLVLNRGFVLGRGGKLSPIYNELKTSDIVLTVSKQLVAGKIGLAYDHMVSAGWNYKKVSSEADTSKIPDDAAAPYPVPGSEGG
jgi:hypothetical protein